jgi:hypothetical protein
VGVMVGVAVSVAVGGTVGVPVLVGSGVGDGASVIVALGLEVGAGAWRGGLHALIATSTITINAEKFGNFLPIDPQVYPRMRTGQ